MRSALLHAELLEEPVEKLSPVLIGSVKGEAAEDLIGEHPAVFSGDDRVNSEGQRDLL